MRSTNSRTFIYFSKNGRITKALHSQRGRGLKSMGGPVNTLFERVLSIVGTGLYEYEDAVQIICEALLDGTLTWRQFVDHRAVVVSEAKRVMLYSGLTIDLRLLSADQSVYTESLGDVVPSHVSTDWGFRKRRKAEKADY